MLRRRRAAVRREQAVASIDLSGQRVDYLLKRSSARRGIALRVNAQGQAQVNAPLAMPMPRIEAFLVEHADWLQAQLARRGGAFAWGDGAVLPYLGGELRLRIGRRAEAMPGRSERQLAIASVDRELALAPTGAAKGGGVELHPDGLLVCTAAKVEIAVTRWYRDQARRVLGERLAAQCARLGLALPPWRLSNARTRWGSLSAKGVVGLNWRLVKASPAEIDYVICHELAHFRHRDHSAAYWREVARLYPEFQAARDRLRHGGTGYMAF